MKPQIGDLVVFYLLQGNNRMIINNEKELACIKDAKIDEGVYFISTKNMSKEEIQLLTIGLYL